jgi:rare lipoprotein A
MNQHRWHCLTVLFLSTISVPTSNVRAQAQVPSARSNSSAPQSLPQVTPLPLTEDRANEIVPALMKSVPQVSNLPIVTPLGKIQNSIPAKQLTIGKIGSNIAQTPRSQSPIAAVPSSAPTFSSTLRVSAPILLVPNPIESSSAVVTAVAPLPQVDPPESATSVTKTFTSQATSAPIFVSRSDNAKLVKTKLPAAVITNSATVQAEIAPTPLSNDSISLKDLPAAAGKPPEVTAVPKVSPLLARYPKDRVDTPSFETGAPVFVLEGDRPHQIIATAIAQVGDTIVAPEPSIAIPVERPKQTNMPSIPVATPAISKIELPAETVRPVLDKIVSTQTGQASWYGAESGGRTASGENFNPRSLTAAHRTLPFGTMVKVTSLKTGKTAIVKINDRGPFRSRRIIDISAGAAEAIGLKSDGVGDVRVDVLSTQDKL